MRRSGIYCQQERSSIMSKKQATLFSFFNKKPAADSATEGKGDVLKPVQKQPNANRASAESKKDDCEYKIGDILMSKLDGYPWWPSLVCNHPTEKVHFHGGKKNLLHVQFFDDPVSRGWVKLKNVRKFPGLDAAAFKVGGTFFTNEETWRKGIEDADKAKELPLDDRMALVIELLSTDEEEEDEDDDKLDSDIFDAEMSSEGEHDNSKENHEGENSPKKTPSKSPGKGGRSRRRATKRRKILKGLDSDPEESGDEFKPPKSDGESSEDGSSGVDEEEITSDDDSEPDSPVKGVKRKRPGADRPRKQKKPVPSKKTGGRTPRIQRKRDSSSEDEGVNTAPNSMEIDEPEKTTSPPEKSKASSFTPTVGTKTKSKLASFSAPETVGAPAAADDGRVFTHLTLDFLKPDKIRDAKKRTPSDPEYDKRTLFLPDDFLANQTPAMRQWWEMKAKHFDIVLFFKMGKFYELFHMDAAIAVNELGVIYMKGDYAHSGFPEIAFGRYSDTLIQKGYKVARIEQTETPDMMQERVKKLLKATKFDKVVKREICRITTKGTKVYSYIDGIATDVKNAYLLAVCEKEGAEREGNTYGICFVDTSIGKFHVGQFEDDRHCSRLRTLISHYPPAQILYERGKISEKMQVIFDHITTAALKEALRSGSEFWESSKTLKCLSEGGYFTEEGDTNGNPKWPAALKQMLADSDALGLTAADEYDLAVRALGAMVWYLKDSCIDDELLSMSNFALYNPIDQQQHSAATEDDGVPAFMTGNHRMVLDGVTLANLDLTQNSSTGTLEGTLLEKLDHCHTPFGKRLVKQWLCAPLCNPHAINDRLDAIEDLLNAQDVTAEVADMMKKLPDLERLLSKIHTLGSASRSKNHPDGRAIFFEDVAYSKRKIEDFLAALGGFEVACKIIKKMGSATEQFKSKVLKQTVTLQAEEDGENNGGRFPDLKELLDFFDNAFDHEKARKDGVIKPRKGVDEEYDAAMEAVTDTQRKLDDYLTQQRKRLGCRNINYWGTGKNRFQLEIPEQVAKNVPDEYDATSQKKGAKRYWTAHIQDLLAAMMEAEDHRDSALRDIMRRIFHSFDKNYRKWEVAVQCLSVLDVLMSLAEFSRCGDGAMCRPEILMPDKNTTPMLEIRDGRHPCIGRTFGGSDFIPNDTVIGIKDENEMEVSDGEAQQHAQSQVVLVTGPNMGGKSTLMRQVGIITVMAQLGCYVPAEKCCLTPVDRVFTRLGASDRIMSGESTFFVELSETSSILQHATKHSLVLLDELGRGTATYDGTAIACAVVNELSQKINCRTLFSTHYHSLVEEFSHDTNVRLGHMACMVENENEEDPSQETITFLYKFVKGACPKSYGFNAARLADLPEDVIQTARAKAKEFENALNRLRWFREFSRISDIGTHKEKLKELHQEIVV